MDKVRRVLRKYIEYIITKIRILWEQKVFRHQDVQVKYILKRQKKSDALVIVFSACTRRGLKARYNYVKTLDNIKCNKLFILDDYAKDQRGSYYIGHDFKFDEEVATEALIRMILEEIKPASTVFCGSSKGGYAALNFGMKFRDSYMVIGAPQYYLASYLKQGNEYTLEHILGEYTLEKEQKLDFYLRGKIDNNKYKDTQKIFIHYSNKEHTYEEHIKDMLADLEKNGYKVEEDVADYENHSDISYYFPDFLRKHVIDICGK